MGRPVPEMMASALRPEAARAIVATAVGEGVQGVEVEHLGRRIVRYTVRSASGAVRLIGKVYETAQGARRGYEALRFLRGHGFESRTADGVSVPAPVAWSAPARLVLMEEVAGTSLKRLVRRGLADRGHMQRFAAAVAKVHGCPAVFGSPFTLDDHLRRRCHDLAGELAAAEPQLARYVQRVIQTARAGERPQAFRLAHGDCHLGQVLLDHGRLWLLDLDPLHYGDPAYDVAMVLVMLGRLEAASKRPAYVRSLRHAFLEAYFARGQWLVARRLPIQTALIHLKRACKRYRYRDEPGWRQTMRQQLRQSAACLEIAAGVDALRSVGDVEILVARCPCAV